jgi:hypothetical protein
MSSISYEWINGYVEALLKGAGALPEGPFKEAVLLRARHVMNLVEAHREAKNRNG